MSVLNALLLMAAPTTTAVPLALPEQTTIPVSFSTVICPDHASASRMLNDYVKVGSAPENHQKITELFLQGLTDTGCQQKSQLEDAKGVITIEKVEQRIVQDLATGPNRYIHFSGKWADGSPLVGLVDEDWNNRLPRTKLADWLSEFVSPDGWLMAEPAASLPRLYRCDDSTKARKAVADTVKAKAKTTRSYEKALSKAATAQGCRAAQDRYFVIGKYENVALDCGFECYYEYNALEAYDRSGLKVGLLFDSSQF
jgi:hypothetical protein